VRLLRTSLALMAVGVALPATANAGYAGRTLTVGDQGRDVKLLQRYLAQSGFRTTADGRFGKSTKLAQRRFERSAELRVDGRATRPDQRRIRAIARGAGSGGTGGTKYEAPPENTGQVAVLGPDKRTAIAPAGAPEAVKDAIAAANRITTKQYRYGGGHGSFRDSGYDCSGAVSYALHGGRLLDSPLDSTSFESWGEAGQGTWITVYANSGHAYTVIAGLRFDTSGRGESGPRWRPEPRSASGFVARHPDGL
jgi:peptidoglycan hydrolase-like protein with peptidoglycan-binding domain